MGLEDYLLPGEEIRYQSAEEVKYGGQKYKVIITNKRLLLYARRGLILKRDDIISEKIEDIQTLRFKEEGIILKEGIIEVVTKTRKWQMRGKADSMKALFLALQEHLKL